MAPLHTQSRPGRRHSILPAPPPRHWKEEVRILEEVGPELGIAFWRMLRRTHVWAAVAPGDRKNLALQDSDGASLRLAGACVFAPQLLETFGTFALLVRDPGGVTGHQLAEACRRVFVWAEERSSLDVAALFAEAAAAADPDAPGRAYDAGRLCRRANYHERSASWYLRAFGLAVRTKSRQEVIKALLGHGNLMKHLGRNAEARVFYERAAQRAISTGRRRQAAEAHHALLTLTAEAGMYTSACRHVRKALENYPVRHPLVPYLVHDFAYVLLQNGYFNPAFGLLVQVAPLIQSPSVLALAHASIARAAGGLRNLQRFKEAEQSALHLLKNHGEHAAPAFNCLAAGAWALSDVTQADSYATTALTTTRATRDMAAAHVAEHLLAAVADGAQPPSEANPSDRDRLDALVQRLASRLRMWEGCGRQVEPAAPHARIDPVTAAEAA